MILASLSEISVSSLDAASVVSESHRDTILSKYANVIETEAMLLVTCRRSELYKSGSGSEGDAARHLFRLCSGLDSAVVGETEIVAQVKQAWDAARMAKTMGPNLDLLLRFAMQTSKRVRSETDLCRGVVSYSGLAVREASALVGGLSNKQVLVLGAGTMAERVLRELQRTPPVGITVISRTLDRATTLASRYNADVRPISDVSAVLAQSEIIFGATAFPLGLPADPGPKLRCMVDLGEPSCLPKPWSENPSMGRVTLDHVIRRCQRNSERRTEAIVRGSEIVEEELLRYRAEVFRREARR